MMSCGDGVATSFTQVWTWSMAGYLLLDRDKLVALWLKRARVSSTCKAWCIVKLRKKVNFTQIRGIISKFCGNRGEISKFYGNRVEHAICIIGAQGGWTPLEESKRSDSMSLNLINFSYY